MTVPISSGASISDMVPSANCHVIFICVSFPLSAEVRRTQKKPEYTESAVSAKWVQKTEGTDNPFQKMKSALSVSFALMYTQASDLFFGRNEKRPGIVRQKDIIIPCLTMPGHLVVISWASAPKPLCTVSYLIFYKTI